MSGTEPPLAPPPSGEWVAEESWLQDSFAIQEERAFPDEEEIRGAHRDNRLKVVRHAGGIILAFMWVASALFLSAFAAWMWHQIAPVHWTWMSTAQLDQIKTIVFSGAVGGLITTAVNRYIFAPR